MVVAPPASTPILIGAVSSNGNRLSHSVRLPSAIQAGDTMLAFLASNTGAAISAPSGWTQLAAPGDPSIQGRLWTRTATAADAGPTVTASTATYTKSDLTVLAYRGGGAPRIVASGGRVDAGGASHTTPALTSSVAALAVSYWADKSGDGTTLAVPSAQVLRASSTGTGGGHVTAAASDRGTLTPAGTIGGLVATGTASSSKAVSFTVLLSGS